MCDCPLSETGGCSPTWRPGLDKNDLEAFGGVGGGGWVHREHQSLEITLLEVGEQAQGGSMTGPRSVVELG